MKDALAKSVKNQEWTTAYLHHPVVQQSIAEDGPPVFPACLYIDGLVYTKKDSVIAFYAFNLITQVRHLVAVLRKSTLCTCGCRGWCSLFPIMQLLAWSFQALAHGLYPAARHDSSDWPASEESRAAVAGKSMPARVVLLHLKGDWSEFAHTLGFPTWSSSLNPCFLCSCEKASMHSVSGASTLGLPWSPHPHSYYLQA